MSEPYATVLREIEEAPDSFSIHVIASWCGKSADEIKRLEAENKKLKMTLERIDLSARMSGLVRKDKNRLARQSKLKLAQAIDDKIKRLEAETERLAAHNKALERVYEAGCDLLACLEYHGFEEGEDPRPADFAQALNALKEYKQ